MFEEWIDAYAISTKVSFACWNVLIHGSREFRQGVLFQSSSKGPYCFSRGIRTSISLETYSHLSFSRGGGFVYNVLDCIDSWSLHSTYFGPHPYSGSSHGANGMPIYIAISGIPLTLLLCQPPSQKLWPHGSDYSYGLFVPLWWTRKIVTNKTYFILTFVTS